ncbi:Splicing factor U2AF 35 kDa subunit [Hondaea fermentalgiana]|uniref:Splicing factor U2AF 35 kDa subunit n=1 Tax=Hondaea fermentalgiana TaxID=2315210 RepID=A0A2R5GYG2_9STRA|nr:Splicing factor U2AF 35 kDa subunit [Hondaea fermentalgiana]|eukprot:GBG33024.1 Splicing factor U2AF 35 kDa subunit [Hondaea fermentalgiana]
MSYGRGGSEWRREESYSRGDYGDRRGGHGSRHGHGGARGLARIYGTEQDRHNCTFYIKMGVCRHGDKCDRAHNKPAFSQTVMIPGMYPNPLAAKVAERKDGSLIPKRASSAERDPNFEEFYVDMFEEVSKAGEVDDIVVCDNLCDHMMGNVYIKFFDEEDADKCRKLVSGRYYQGKRLDAEFVPVTDFSLSRCRQYDRRECDRGGAVTRDRMAAEARSGRGHRRLESGAMGAMIVDR